MSTFRPLFRIPLSNTHDTSKKNNNMQLKYKLHVQVLNGFVDFLNCKRLVTF